MSDGQWSPQGRVTVVVESLLNGGCGGTPIGHPISPWEEPNLRKLRNSHKSGADGALEHRFGDDAQRVDGDAAQQHRADLVRPAGFFPGLQAILDAFRA